MTANEYAEIVSEYGSDVRMWAENFAAAVKRSDPIKARSELESMKAQCASLLMHAEFSIDKLSEDL